MKDKFRSAKAAQIGKKAHISQLERQSPCTETLFENLMDLEGAEEAWLGLMEEDTLFNIHDWKAGHDKKSNKKRKSR